VAQEKNEARARSRVGAHTCPGCGRITGAMKSIWNRGASPDINGRTALRRPRHHDRSGSWCPLGGIEIEEGTDAQERRQSEVRDALHEL
jgi:hypothetical protein